MSESIKNKYQKMAVSFLTAFHVSFVDSNQWIIETYKKIPKNEFQFGSDGLKIKVANSASPLIFKFPETKTIKSFNLEGHLSSLPKGILKQGSKGHDDFPLRVGFVVPGNKKLNRFEKWVAADWVLRLFSLVPKDLGLDKVVFFNMFQKKELSGTERVHPLSEYLLEKFSFLNTEVGNFKWDQKIEPNLKTLALWISADGDDTQSSYEVHLKQLHLD